jgi:hypothetical protein
VFEKKKFVFNYLIVDKQNKDLTTSYKCTDWGLSIFTIEILVTLILKILYEDDILSITVWLILHDPVGPGRVKRNGFNNGIEALLYSKVHAVLEC